MSSPTQTPRIFAVVLILGLVSGTYCLLFGSERADNNPALTCTDANLPHIHAPVPCHSGNTARIVALNPVVYSILALGDNTEVSFPIIQGVPVDVVHILPRLRLHDNSVHGYRVPPVSGVKGVRAGAILNGKPCNTTKKFVIVGVNNGDFAASQRDVSDRLILRLNNRSAVRFAYPHLGHDSTSNGIAAVQPLLYSTKGNEV